MNNTRLHLSHRCTLSEVRFKLVLSQLLITSSRSHSTFVRFTILSLNALTRNVARYLLLKPSAHSPTGHILAIHVPWVRCLHVVVRSMSRGSEVGMTRPLFTCELLTSETRGLEQQQYTSDSPSETTRVTLRHSVELFLGH